MDLRCEHRMLGALIDGVVEIKCTSALCGARTGVVVIHRWDALTGERLDDKRFASPVATARQTKERAAR